MQEITGTGERRYKSTSVNNLKPVSGTLLLRFVGHLRIATNPTRHHCIHLPGRFA